MPSRSCRRSLLGETSRTTPGCSPESACQDRAPPRPFRHSEEFHRRLLERRNSGFSADGSTSQPIERRQLPGHGRQGVPGARHARSRAAHIRFGPALRDGRLSSTQRRERSECVCGEVTGSLSVLPPAVRLAPSPQVPCGTPPERSARRPPGRRRSAPRAPRTPGSGQELRGRRSRFSIRCPSIRELYRDLERAGIPKRSDARAPSLTERASPPGKTGV